MEKVVIKMNIIELFYEQSFRITHSPDKRILYEIDRIKLSEDSPEIQEMHRLLSKGEDLVKEIKIWREGLNKK